MIGRGGGGLASTIFRMLLRGATGRGGRTMGGLALGLAMIGSFANPVPGAVVGVVSELPPCDGIECEADSVLACPELWPRACPEEEG